MTREQQMADRLRQALTDLPGAYAKLGRALVPLARLTRDTGSRQRHNDSVRSPVNLTAVDLANEHHKIGIPLTRTDYQLDKIAGRRMGVLPTLGQWVRLVDAELWDAGIGHRAPGQIPCSGFRIVSGDLAGVTSCTGDDEDRTHLPPPSIDDECAWLLGHIDWIAAQPWLDEIHDDVTHMLRDVLAVIGEQPERHEPMVCTSCGWPVSEQDGGGWYKCTGCGKAWSRLELHRMAERKKPKTLAELTKPTGLSIITLRRYENDGRITPIPERRGTAKQYDLDQVMDATQGERYKRGKGGRFTKKWSVA